MTAFIRRSWFIAAGMVTLSGCATVPYMPGGIVYSEKTLRLQEGEAQIERGKPVKVVDGLGHYVISLPIKLVLWSWRAENHKISSETEELLQRYLAENGMDYVKVRLNQYRPGKEWNRLFKNKEVGAGWRYTLGVLSLIEYTLLPGRLFGGDHYNPYTNTVNLFSDHEAICLHEAAHAKDFGRRRWKGTYAAAGLLPLMPLYCEAKATGDAIGYLRDQGLIDEEKKAYKVLYPAYGTYLAREGLNWVDPRDWVVYGVEAGVVIPAHVVGRVKAHRRGKCVEGSSDVPCEER